MLGLLHQLRAEWRQEEQVQGTQDARKRRANLLWIQGRGLRQHGGSLQEQVPGICLPRQRYVPRSHPPRGHGTSPLSDNIWGLLLAPGDVMGEFWHATRWPVQQLVDVGGTMQQQQHRYGDLCSRFRGALRQFECDP